MPTTDKKQLLTIALGTLIVTALGYYFLTQRDLLATRVQAVGSLIFTFNGVDPDSKVFDEADVKPGDCYVRTVEVTNEGASSADIAVRAEDVLDPGSLSPIFSLLITEGVTTLYDNTVAQFMVDALGLPDGVPLSALGAGLSTTYSFEVCMPPEAGNEYQDKTMTFDLVFGTYVNNDIPVPDECESLAGQIENVIYGTEEGEFIHGTVNNDLIYGYGGDDHIDGSGGNDCIIGGPGDDHLEGEDGNDVLVGNGGNDLLEAGSGDDLIIAGDGNDEIEAGSGNDIVYCGEGDDVVNAGSGDDVVYCGPGVDEIKGKTGFDEIHGGSGNDTIEGGSDDDSLYGDEGDDHIEGGSGDDYLDGGPGTDSLTGNTGVDTCLNGEVLASCE